MSEKKSFLKTQIENLEKQQKTLETNHLINMGKVQGAIEITKALLVKEEAGELSVEEIDKEPDTGIKE